MKKLCLFIAGLFLAVGLYAQQINSKLGYKDGISWGMKRNDVNKKLPSGSAKLKKLNKDKNSQSYKDFADSVEIYESSPNSTDEIIVYYYFLDDKLFLIEETLKKEASTIEKLKSRYIGLSETNSSGTKTLWDRSVANDGYITQSIRIIFLTGPNDGCAFVRMYDRETYKKASKTNIPDYEKVEKVEKAKKVVAKNIVEELANLAKKLVQSSTKKSTYAFIALTSDNGNALIENYVTDALTEAMFDTGKIKIVERASIEKIMSEQQFQSTALVNENTAVEIGNLSGASFVCYGTVKDLGTQLTLNVKVVEVSTAELCSMGRETVNKDKYLHSVGFEKRANNVAKNTSATNGVKGSSTSTTETKAEIKVEETKPIQEKKPRQNLKSSWQVQKKNNGSYTSYLFISKGPGDQFLFVGYDKHDSVGGSCVRSGIYWVPKAVDVGGTYDVKEDDGAKVTKDFSWAWWSYDLGWGNSVVKYGQGYLHPYGGSSFSAWPSQISEKNTASKCKIDDKTECFAFTYNNGESARFWLERIDRNDFLAVKHNNESFRFQTAGIWETVEDQGLTREEIMEAIANDEF